MVLKAPQGLLDTLVADIRLPRVPVAQVAWRAPAPWFRRWLPAISLAAILLTCLVAIGVQTNLLSELTRQNASLRAAAKPLEALRQENAEYKRLTLENQELERLRKDNVELQNLRGEVAQLGSQAQSLEILRAENQRLRAVASTRLAAATEPADDAFRPKPKRARNGFNV